MVSPNDLGYPGFLTAHEQEVLVSSYVLYTVFRLYSVQGFEYS